MLIVAKPADLADGTGDLRSAVSFLIKNQSWVVGELSKARDSVGAAKDAYKGKADVVADLRRRVQIVERDSLNVTTQLRRHELNLSAIHVGLTDS